MAVACGSKRSRPQAQRFPAQRSLKRHAHNTVLREKMENIEIRRKPKVELLFEENLDKFNILQNKG